MGMWHGSHQFFYSAAYVEYELYEQRLNKLLEAEKAFEKIHSAVGDYKASLISHETADLRKSCMRSAYSALMFGCMSFEAFLNNYGVRRLGEAYYKRFVERMGIVEKLVYLLSIGKAEVVAFDDEVIGKCRRLFDARNGLAHPKTREAKIDDEGSIVLKDSHPSQFPIKEHFEDLEFCIEVFCQCDQEIQKDFEFERDSESIQNS